MTANWVDSHKPPTTCLHDARFIDKDAAVQPLHDFGNEEAEAANGSRTQSVAHFLHYLLRLLSKRGFGVTASFRKPLDLAENLKGSGNYSSKVFDLEGKEEPPLVGNEDSEFTKHCRLTFQN